MQRLLLRDHERFMRAAVGLAVEAGRAGEVPVGAVVVHQGRIVGRGANRQIADRDPTAHAEIVALREAAQKLGDHRLPRATIYCTLEPCAMCAGALVNARLERLVFGSRDLRFGAVRSKYHLADSEFLNHRLEIVEGVLAGACLAPLRAFFAARRQWAGASLPDRELASAARIDKADRLPKE